MSLVSRRQLLSVAMALPALAACGRAAAEPVSESAPGAIYDRINELERQYNAYVGLFARDLAAGRTLAHREDDPFAMCSTFKAYAVARALQKSARGELDLRQAIFIDPADLLPYAPATEPQVGNTMPLAQLCVAAVQLSDNTAANLVLRAIGGPPAVTDFARSIDDDLTRLDRWEPELNSATPGDPRDTSTPRALGSGMQKLLTGTALGEPQRRQLEDWMRNNTTSSMRAGLPGGWTSADKTGNGSYGSTNDVGIAYGPNGQRVLLSVMTRSQSTDPDTEAMRPLIADVTRSVMPWLAGQG